MRPAKDNLLVTNRQGPAVKAGMPCKTFRQLLPPRTDHAGNPDAGPNRFYAYGVVSRLALLAASLELERTAPAE